MAPLLVYLDDASAISRWFNGHVLDGHIASAEVVIDHQTAATVFEVISVNVTLPWLLMSSPPSPVSSSFAPVTVTAAEVPWTLMRIPPSSTDFPCICITFNIRQGDAALGGDIHSISIITIEQGMGNGHRSSAAGVVDHQSGIIEAFP